MGLFALIDNLVTKFELQLFVIISILQCKCFQDSNTRQLVFKTEELIAWLTQFFTLLPGDVILTGTPPGVGVFMKPPQFLKAR